MGNCHCLAQQNLGKDMVNDRALSHKSLAKNKGSSGSTAEEDQALKIQSAFRGHKARAEVSKIKLDQYKARVVEQLRLFIENSAQYSLVSKFPQFEYNEDELDDEFFGNRNFKGPTEIAGGGIYAGEWVGEQRHGKGIMVFSDGSVYEGIWAKNLANGKGRLVHVDGDAYDGEWKDDKAHGIGKYIHADGAGFEGQWKNDIQEGIGIDL